MAAESNQKRGMSHSRSCQKCWNDKTKKIQSCRNALLYLQLGPIYPEGWLWGKCELSSRTTETRAGWKKTFSYYHRMAANTGSRCLQWSMGTECQRERREINLSLNVHFGGYPSKMMKTAPQLYHFFPLHPLPDLHPSLLLCGPRRANLNLFHCDIAQHFCSRGSASEPGPASAASCASIYVRSPEEQLPSSGAELTDCLGLLSASSQRLAPRLQLSNPAKFDHLHTLWSKCTLQWCVTPLCLQENSRRDLEKKKNWQKLYLQLINCTNHNMNRSWQKLFCGQFLSPFRLCVWFVWCSSQQSVTGNMREPSAQFHMDFAFFFVLNPKTAAHLFLCPNWIDTPPILHTFGKKKETKKSPICFLINV